MLAILPFTVLIPAITASHWVNEIRFCRKWAATLEQGERRPRMLWDLNAQLDTTLAN
jgi:hypothetical protein